MALKFLKTNALISGGMTDMVLCGELSVPNHTEVEPFSYSISLGKKY